MQEYRKKNTELEQILQKEIDTQEIKDKTLDDVKLKESFSYTKELLR